MSRNERVWEQLVRENQELYARLLEAEEMLQAIRSGEVDALVVSGPQGEQVYTLQGVDYTYRLLIEGMKEGAATWIADGTILYCNSHFGELVKTPLEKATGSSIHDYVASADQWMFEALLRQAVHGSASGELTLKTGDGGLVPVNVSLNVL
jgi:PAS domain-containing protein